MGNYASWRAHADKQERRRITYVCGDQRALVDDVVSTTRRMVGAGPLDYESTTGTDPGLWAKTHQHPMAPGGNRLVVIRDAEKITSWEPLTIWVTQRRTLPGVHLIFVSNDADLPRQNTAKRAAAADHIEAMKPPRGYVVRCSSVSAADALAWVIARSTMDERTARHLLTRVGGDLTAAGAVCAKLRVFGDVDVTTTIIDNLVDKIPGDTFVELLLAGHKSDAFASISDIPDREAGKVIGLLDSRLDLLAKLWDAQAQGRYGQQIHGINPFLIRQYTPIAKHYEPARCAHSRQVLAVVDDALRQGARAGVWETLVALW